MIELQNILKDKLDIIRVLCKANNVKKLFAFGSVCTEKFNEHSDVDLLVSFFPMDYNDYADSYFEFAEKLEQLFHRQVDLITENSLKNPYFIESVNRTKTLIYG